MNKRIDDIRNFVQKVDGWLFDKEGMLLYRLANRCKGKGVIVEIGSWKGKSTIWLASGSKDGCRLTVYAIDPHTGSQEHREPLGKVWTFEEFNTNIQNARLTDIVKPLVKTSEEAAKEFKEPIELLFIDGAHDYESTRLDLTLWTPKVVDGGIVVFHDTMGQSGARKVVEEYVFDSTIFRDVGFLRSLTFAEKVAENSSFDILKNRYVLFLKNQYQIACNSKLRRPIKKLWKNLLAISQF